MTVRAYQVVVIGLALALMAVVVASNVHHAAPKPTHRTVVTCQITENNGQLYANDCYTH